MLQVPSRRIKMAESFLQLKIHLFLTRNKFTCSHFLQMAKLSRVSISRIIFPRLFARSKARLPNRNTNVCRNERVSIGTRPISGKLASRDIKVNVDFVKSRVGRELVRFSYDCHGGFPRSPRILSFPVRNEANEIYRTPMSPSHKTRDTHGQMRERTGHACPGRVWIFIHRRIEAPFLTDREQLWEKSFARSYWRLLADSRWSFDYSRDFGPKSFAFSSFSFREREREREREEYWYQIEY